MFQLARSSGILLHPTSLPCIDGIGDLGQQAYHFADWLTRGRQRWWQILPLNPAGPGNSPYASPSAFAISPLLISLDTLAGQGLLDRSTFSSSFDSHRIDFAAVERFKMSALRAAFQRFESNANTGPSDFVVRFQKTHANWLDDFAMFMALKEAHSGVSWQEWELPLRLRDANALRAARQELSGEIAFHGFCQAVAFDQWMHLKRYANERNIRFIGDIPIFVALDSADVWANQSLFRLTDDAKPEVVSGVPPDLFTADGQLWGNPVYNWQRHAETGFQWWIDRVAAVKATVDMIRVDHFRGFAAAWVIPADAANARPGRWERASGNQLFDAIESELGELPLIAEDLGLITPDVDVLRLQLGLPGMKVLQFGFGGDASNAYLPHNYERHTVAYTGTHDNQTTIGWFASQPEHVKRHVQSYLGNDASDIAWEFIRLAWASAADVAVSPLQDLLRLDDHARMNAPGSAVGNWEWRFEASQLDDGIADGIAEMTVLYGRVEIPPSQRQYDPYDYAAPDTAHQLYG